MGTSQHAQEAMTKTAKRNVLAQMKAPSHAMEGASKQACLSRPVVLSTVFMSKRTLAAGYSCQSQMRENRREHGLVSDLSGIVVTAAAAANLRLQRFALATGPACARRAPAGGS